MKLPLITAIASMVAVEPESHYGPLRRRAISPTERAEKEIKRKERKAERKRRKANRR